MTSIVLHPVVLAGPSRIASPPASRLTAETAKTAKTADYELVTQVPDARYHLSQLVGQQIPTMTGKPNRILQVHGSDVLVGTTRSPEGQRVPIKWVQSAMDRLLVERELEINPQSVGYRSAFVGGVLLTCRGLKVPSTRSAFV